VIVVVVTIVIVVIAFLITYTVVTVGAAVVVVGRYNGSAKLVAVVAFGSSDYCVTEWRLWCQGVTTLVLSSLERQIFGFAVVFRPGSKLGMRGPSV
jgi:hypothetical protein